MNGLSLFDGFLLGVVGGLLPEVYALYRLRHTFHKKKPDWFTSGFFWWVTLAMVIAGGVVVCGYLLSGVKLTHWMAVHIGMTTPVLLNTAIAKPPRIK